MHIVSYPNQPSRILCSNVIEHSYHPWLIFSFSGLTQSAACANFDLSLLLQNDPAQDEERSCRTRAHEGIRGCTSTLRQDEEDGDS